MLVPPHPSVTVARVQALLDRGDHWDLENDTELGLCIECGTERPGVGPYVERGACPACGKHGLYGITQLYSRMTGW